jgi:hypothetical protein
MEQRDEDSGGFLTPEIMRRKKRNQKSNKNGR